MINREFWSRLGREIKNLFPLFRYLVLQTETHAFCLALAGAALLGFFPACLVVLAIFKNVLGWDGAYQTVLTTIDSYFPTSQDAVVAGLRTSVGLLGHKSQLGTLLWVLLGAAGVFIPLESGLNRLWKAQEDRPYWLNQVVGFTLTIVCVFLGLFFLSISAVLHQIVSYFPSHFPFDVLRSILSFFIIRITMTALFVASIFALYKFLPNRKVDASQVLPAAIVAGVMAELVREIYTLTVPNFVPTQGPFAASVTFLLLVYFETFVVLGCAFLATETERYPWMGFLKRKRVDAPDRAGPIPPGEGEGI